MTGLDTNILVRYLLKDDPDPHQAELARKAIERAMEDGDPVVISLLTILETEWVLRSYGSLEKKMVISTFRMMLESRDVMIEHEDSLEEALYLYENNSADFADCLMVARYTRLGCSAMLTFDKKAAGVSGVVLMQ